MSTALRRPLPPLLAALLLEALGHRRGAVVLVLVSVLLLVTGIAAPSAVGRLDHAIARMARAAATGVSGLLARLAWLFGVLPMWLWGRAWRTSPIGNGWIGAQSAWTIPPSSTHRDLADAPGSPRRSGAPDALPPPRSTGRRLIRAGLALVLAVTGMVVVAERRGVALPFGSDDAAAVEAPDAQPAASSDMPVPDGRRAGGEDPVIFGGVEFPRTAPGRAEPLEVDQYHEMPVDEYAHEDEPWAPRHFGDLTQLPYAPDPFVGLRLVDFTSDTINVVGGRRVSYTPDDPELTVWFFGGSTMFGIGQRDNHTLPSVVAKAAEADGIRIRPVNFGVPGYVNWQGLEQFEQALTSDLDRPDLVVFYDGVNDRGLGGIRVDQGERAPGLITRHPFSDAEREQVLNDRGRPEPMPWSDERQDLEIDVSADQYGRGAEIARRLGTVYGIPIEHVWQPDPWSKARNPVEDPLWERVDFNPEWLEENAADYRKIAERSGADPIDLTRALDDVDVPVYFDGGHTNELGARIIGRALYRALRSELEKASARR